MILIDTSILIGYFKGLHDSPYDVFDGIIEHDIPFGICNHIYQEVLQGAKNEMEFEQLKEYLGEIPVYDLLYGQKSYEDAALAYFKCRRAGITIRSSVDLIIAQTAIENNLFLFHNDNDFVQLAAVMPELRLLP